MMRRWDNPVARHAARLGARGAWWWVILILLGAVVLLGALLQKYWMELELYTLLRPQRLSRWVAVSLLGETAIALPWAAVRGALLWRRLAGEGHLEEYRRSRLSALSIAAGSLFAALTPVLVLLGASLTLALAAGLATRALGPVEVLTVHGLLLAQSVAFAALGLWLAGRLRIPGFAIPVAFLVLTAAIGAIWAVDPQLRKVDNPTDWIFWALLPNPVSAVGTALDTDVLRFSWIYQNLHAHEYFFVYPAPWQTAVLYLAGTAVLLWRITRRIRQLETR